MTVVSLDAEIDADKLESLTGFKDILIEGPNITNSITKCEKGCVPPFGSLWNMRTYIDADVRENSVISFKVGDQSNDITMSYRDYYKVEEPYVVDISKKVNAPG